MHDLFWYILKIVHPLYYTKMLREFSLQRGTVKRPLWVMVRQPFRKLQFYNNIIVIVILQNYNKCVGLNPLTAFHKISHSERHFNITIWQCKAE